MPKMITDSGKANRYVFTFKKFDLMIYISHLDLQRLFRRTLKSAGYKIAYSYGFNPHPKISLAQPLSLGYTGMREFMEVELMSDDNPELVKKSLNENLPKGIEVTSAGLMPDSIKSLSASTCAAVYKIVSSKEFPRISQNVVDDFLSQEKIYGLRRHKKTKKMVETEIKDKIHWMRLRDGNILEFQVDCGSNSNLNPEVLLKSFFKFCNLSHDESIIQTLKIFRMKIILEDKVDKSIILQ